MICQDDEGYKDKGNLLPPSGDLTQALSSVKDYTYVDVNEHNGDVTVAKGCDSKINKGMRIQCI